MDASIALQLDTVSPSHHDRYMQDALFALYEDYNLLNQARQLLQKSNQVDPAKAALEYARLGAEMFELQKIMVAAERDMMEGF